MWSVWRIKICIHRDFEKFGNKETRSTAVLKIDKDRNRFISVNQISQQVLVLNLQGKRETPIRPKRHGSKSVEEDVGQYL